MSRKSKTLTVPDNRISALNGAVVPESITPTRLDFGCGPHPKPGFKGVDIIAFPGVDYVIDLTQKWPWEDSSVEDANASHFIEHLTNFEGKWERVKFFNELYRVLIPGGKCSLVLPHWASIRYYGDPTHREPWSEMAFFYLSREWRLGNPEKGIPAQAPHTDIQYNPNGYSCDFEAGWGFALHPQIALKNQEAQQFCWTFYKEAIQDIQAVVTARKVVPNG